MRKIIIFLLAFGSGFLVLWTLRTPQVDGGNGEVEERPDAPEPEALTRVSAGNDKEGAISVALQGRLEDTAYYTEEEGGGKQYFLVAQDTQPIEGNVYELTDLHVEFYDRETGELMAEADSSVTEMKIETDDEGKLAFGEQMSISNVELTMHSGMPVVPITVRVPLLVGSLKEGRFSSNDLVQVEAQGVDAEGTGLVVDTSLSSLRLVRDGRIQLDLERGGRVVLEAIGVGPIDFLRHGTEEEPEVEIRASENARFTLEGQAPIVAVGDEIVIRASSRGEPEARRFRATEAYLTGDTTIEGQNSVFRSRRADVAFDELGALSEVTLVGDPTGRVEIARFLDPDERPELYATFADVSGQGPLRIRFTEGTGLDLLGPGRVEIPERELVMTAKERIVGFVTPEADGGERSGEIEATGDVHVTYQGRELTSNAVAMRYASPAPGEEALDLDAEGPALLTGDDPDGRPTSVVATGGGSFRSRGGKISAPVVRGVRIEAQGEGGYVASADEVRDFVWDTRTFEALGNVVYETAAVRGTGARAVATGPDEIELFGDEERKARFQLWQTDPEGAPEQQGRVEQGFVEAAMIVVSEGHAHATNDVVCGFHLADERYRLLCNELELDYALESLKGRRAFETHARGECRVEVSSPQGEASLTCRELDVEGYFLEGDAAEQAGSSLGRSQLNARHDVRIDYSGTAGIAGTADLFTIDERGRGRLSMEGEGTVYVRGEVPGTNSAYEMNAEWVEFDREHFKSRKGRIQLIEPDAGEDSSMPNGDGGGGPQGTEGDAAPGQGSEEPAAQGQAGSGGDEGGNASRLPFGGRGFLRSAYGDETEKDPTSLLLEGNAYIEGETDQEEPWRIEAGAIQALGRFDVAPGATFSLDDVDLLEARNGFVARLGERMRASGRRLTARPGRVRIEGAPARFEVSGVSWESDWIELDPDNLLLGTGRGTLRPEAGAEDDWVLNYESMQPFDDVDATMLVLRNPVFVSEGVARREIRAAWALFWLDKSDWNKSTGELIGGPTSPEDLRVTKPDEAPSPRSEGEDGQIEEYASILNEIYIEGNIEFLEDDRRLASAQAYYLNRLDGHGWVQDANVSMDLDRGGKTETIRVKARWMRVTADLDNAGVDPTERLRALRADQAVITSCGFEEPHYVIETGDLRIRRNERSKVGYDFSARKNRARFLNGLVIPLPPLNFGTDEQGNPTVGGFQVGNSARFGSVVTANASLPLPSWSRKLISSPLDLEDAEVTGGTRTSLGFLSSRGFLFGVGQQIRASDRLWLDVFYDAVPDSGSDLGLVRSKENDEREYRDWIHGRGRLLLRQGEWIDLAFTKQRDAGFQAEFFQREFLPYEEQDNYLHWRKAKNNVYYDASAAVRLEDFRTYVEELPSGGVYLSPTPVTSLAGNPVLYTADARTGYYRRKFGTEPSSPFDPIFRDSDLTGDGNPDDFDVLRFDTSHRLEMPIELGTLGLKATPYLSGRATVWDEGLEGASSPSRFAGFIGLQLATTFFRRFDNGSIHQFAPLFGVRAEVAANESGDTPVQIDTTEDSIEGTFVDLGFRTTWYKPNAVDPGREPRLDLEVRASHGSSTSVDDGWQPMTVLGQVLTYAGKVPVGVFHDGRYDLDEDDQQTIYSFSGLGFEPVDDLGIEFGYSQGREDVTGTSLFRAASVGTRYRATEKWEFGVQQGISLLDDGSLFTTVVVRRVGHDFVTELEFEDRAGEGTALGISLRPRISWRRRPLGLVDNWLGTYR